MPGTLQRAFHVSTHFIITTVQLGKYYHLHFADEKKKNRQSGQATSERASKSSKVTYLISDRAKIQIHAV